MKQNLIIVIYWTIIWTLQMINLINEIDINDTNKTIPNIRKNYTTDKADGSRKLLFINENGKIYLILY